MLKKLIFIILSLGIISVSYSQYRDIHFSRISTEDGLSSSWVRCFYQDRLGFIWIGTSDGLSRFDGNEVVVYRYDEKNNNSLLGVAVNYILERKDGKIWICTELGVSVFDREKNTFKSFPYLENVRVVHVMTDHLNNTWFSSNSGLYRYNASDSTLKIFRNYPDDPKSPASSLVEICYEDASNNIWVGTSEGLDLYIEKDNTFKHFQARGRKGDISGNHVFSITEDKDGRMWIGIEKSGLDVFIKSENSADQGSFIHVLNGSINHMMIDHNNHLWIGHSLGLGLEIFDLNLFKPGKPPVVINYINDHTNSLSISDNTISHVFEDRNHGIWIGTFAGGVSYYMPDLKKFYTVRHIPDDLNSLSNSVVNCFIEDGSFLWVGTEKGLCRFNTKTNKVQRYFYEAEKSTSLGADGVISMLKDSRGFLWIGTWNGGLNLYNYSQDNFYRYQQNREIAGSICSNHVVSMLEDRKGNLWIGTDGGGLVQYNYETGSFTCFKKKPEELGSIYHNAVNDICETSDGRLFLSVYHSLELFDPKTKTFTHFIHNKLDTLTISAGNILDIFEDSRQHLWIATTTGLNYFDQKRNIFKRYDKDDGLPINTIQSIIEDNHGNLWLGTNNGLSKFVSAVNLPEHPVFVNYTVEDGLQGNEFVRRSVLKTSKGQLFFGGSKGYTFFYPDSIHENSIIPDVVLIDFRIFDKNNPGGTYNSFDKDINFIDKVTLSYKQSDFTIKYAALNYLNPKENQYRYILEGYETEWHNVGNERTAIYSNINPGKYTFKVLGSNNDGIWNPVPKTLNVRITPPWWKTMLAKILFPILFLLLLFVIYRFRFSLVERQKKLLEEKVIERTIELSDVNSLLEEKQEEIIMQNEELTKHRNHLESLVAERTSAMEAAIGRAEASDKLKSAFLANMSHEIRTPMNAIVGFTSLLKNEEISQSEKKEYLDIISNNCEILMVLINDILDISLIEANQLRLNKNPFNVDKVLEEFQNYYQLSNSKNLTIEFIKTKSKKPLILSNDQTRFKQVVTNLINNALKYTSSGHIYFGYKIKDQEILFYVEDTGIGIDESEYQKIFQYFHKIDTADNKLYRGAGIGLSISNKLVEQMGGKIWLDSYVDKGTTFYFTLPSQTDEEIKSKINVESPKELTVQNLSGKLIIIAEDEPNNYILIEKILRPTKADVIWAKNGREAVEYVEKYSSKKEIIILMDIKMPVMNGIHASEEIRKLNKQIPIIAVTAYAQIENKEEILRHNFKDYIAKPIDPVELLQKVYIYANYLLDG